MATQTVLSPLIAQRAASRKFYQLMLRWHFFCGVLFTPLIVVLCISGCIYLFQDEYETYAYKDQLFVQPQQQRLPASQLIENAKAKVPQMRVSAYKQFFASNRSVEIVFKPSRKQQKGGSGMTNRLERISVFINPYNGVILGSLSNGDRLMEIMKDLHGNLLTGKFGTKFVELSACWLMMLMITGLVMWWPRCKDGVMGTFIPRLTGNRRLFWRDLHAVPAFYFSFLIIFLIVSGLPWTDVWGGAFHALQKALNQSDPAAFHSRELKSVPIAGKSQISIDTVVAIAQREGITGDLEVKLPKSKTDTYAIEKKSDDPAKRTSIHFDQYSRQILAKSDWQKTPVMSKAVAWGIKLHRGEYFGVANLLLVLVTSLVLLLMSISGWVMWLQRKPRKKLGAPKRPRDYASPHWVVAVTVMCAVLMPVLGVSLLLFLCGDWLFRKCRLFVLDKRRPVKAQLRNIAVEEH